MGSIHARLLAFLMATPLVLTAGFATQASAADLGEIQYSIFGNDGRFLTGQSAFIQSRNNSGTSGGQLDGATGNGSIQFAEVFPEPSLTDYLTFSYLGILASPLFDEFGDPLLDGEGNQIIDRSLVIGFNPDFSALGLRVQDIFAATGYDESVLVNAFTTQFDSPEFLDMAFTQVGGNQPSTSAEIGLFETQCDALVCDPLQEVRSTGFLNLYAFTDGIAGDEASFVGSLSFTMTRTTIVPEPGTALMMGLGLAGLAIQRRRAA